MPTLSIWRLLNSEILDNNLVKLFDMFIGWRCTVDSLFLLIFFPWFTIVTGYKCIQLEWSLNDARQGL